MLAPAKKSPPAAPTWVALFGGHPGALLPHTPAGVMGGGDRLLAAHTDCGLSEMLLTIKVDMHQPFGDNTL